MTDRLPKRGEVWTYPPNTPVLILDDDPDSDGEYAVRTIETDGSSAHLALPLSYLRPPRLTLADLPQIPEWWANVHSDGVHAVYRGTQLADAYAHANRIARVRMIPDPDGIVACNGNEVLG